MKLKFWGTRGSIPVPGKDTEKYGGNTPCVEIRTNQNNVIILDGGTGIRELGNNLVRNGNEDIFILLSHYHWDHIQGIPFFTPLYHQDRQITFYGLSGDDGDIESMLSRQMTRDYFPVSFKDLAANVDFRKIKPGDSFTLGELNIETIHTNHSSPALTYKIYDKGKSIVYMPDNEIVVKESLEKTLFDEFEELNKPLIEFCMGSDYLIHDTMYEEISVRGKKGWGHSSNLSAVHFSILADIKNLVLFHFNPEYSDSKVDEMVTQAKEVLKRQNSGINCFAAKEGMEIEV
jgi:phosphoribosyl 1,2-cyclic phosphodiesterase